MVQRKKNTGIQLRTPKTKAKLGLSVPRIGLPHDDFVKSDSTHETDLMSVLGMTSQTGMPDSTGHSDVTGQAIGSSQTSLPTLSSPTDHSVAMRSNIAEPQPRESEYPAVPVIIEPSVVGPTSDGRDPDVTDIQFTAPSTLTAHPSLTSLSVPTTTPLLPVTTADPLPGKSRALYAALHQMTYGADNPSPSVRIRRSDLMRMAGIGSRNTFIANLRRLEAAGLVRQTVIVGEADGNEFHVTDTQPGAIMTTLTGQTTSQTVPPPSVGNLTESLITAIAQSGATPEVLANALEQAARQLREGK